MKIKMIATDMDGTLLDERGEVDLPRLEQILDGLDKQDIRFVIATGNEIHRMRDLLGPLIDRVVLVVANGARIFEKNQMILGKFWEQDLVEQTIAHFRGREVADQLVVTALNGGFVKEGTVFTEIEKFMKPEMVEGFYQRMNFVPELAPSLFPDVLKMSLVVGLERTQAISQEIQDSFGGRLMAVSSGYGSMDILQAGIHKAWGIEQLLDRWQLTPEQIMAFGDSENDREMLEMTPHSYAMANAEETVKAVAQHQAPSNREGGVYQVLEEFLGMTGD